MALALAATVMWSVNVQGSPQQDCSGPPPLDQRHSRLLGSARSPATESGSAAGPGPAAAPAAAAAPSFTTSENAAIFYCVNLLSKRQFAPHGLGTGEPLFTAGDPNAKTWASSAAKQSNIKQRAVGGGSRSGGSSGLRSTVVGRDRWQSVQAAAAGTARRGPRWLHPARTPRFGYAARMPCKTEDEGRFGVGGREQVSSLVASFQVGNDGETELAKHGSSNATLGCPSWKAPSQCLPNTPPADECTSTCDPCTWPGITCVDGHVQEIQWKYSDPNPRAAAQIFTIDINTKRAFDGGRRLQGQGAERTSILFLDLQFGFNLTEAIGELTSLRVLVLPGTGLSGTVPSALGNTRLEHLDLGRTRVSGTLPNNKLRATNVDISRTRISGTIPSGIWKQPLTRLLVTRSRLSGSIPPIVANFPSMTSLDLSGMQLEGSVPAFGDCGLLVSLLLQNNRFVGAPPNLAGCSSLKSVDLNSNMLTSLSLPGVETWLPPSLTHLYFDANPLNATMTHLNAVTQGLPDLHALDLSFINIDVMLDCRACDAVGAACSGTRVLSPLSCQLGDNAQVCTWKLVVYDKDDQPTITGGLVTGLMLGHECNLVESYDNASFATCETTESVSKTMGCVDVQVSVGTMCCTFARCNHTAPMVDNHDGTFTATASPDWVKQKGLQAFRFFSIQSAAPTAFGSDDFGFWTKTMQVHSEGLRMEFMPTLDVNSEDPCETQAANNKTKRKLCQYIRVPEDWQEAQRLSREREMAKTPGNGPYEHLTTVMYTELECPKGSHTVPDARGVECVCAPGFVADVGESSGNSCHRLCGPGMAVGRTGNCECSDNFYDTGRNGAVLCVGGYWSAELYQDTTFLEVQTARDIGQNCSKCPTECATCSDGQVILKEGWRLNSSDDQLISTIMDGANGRVQWAFNCPSVGYSGSSCPQLSLASARSDSSTANATETRCNGEHNGRLCSTCRSHYSRKSSDNSCTRCANVQLIETEFGLSIEQLIGLIGGAAAVVVSIVRSQKDRIKRIKREIYTNCKIIIGLAQILALLKDVLSMVFPPAPQHAMSFAALATTDLRSLVQLDCPPWDYSWYDKWWLTVVWIPGFIFSIVGLRYWYERYRGSEQAGSNCVQSSFFVVMLLHPRVSSAILETLRCRRLGPGINVLYADYSVDCTSQQYGRYHLAASLLGAVVVLGIPFGLLGALFRQWGKSGKAWRGSSEHDDNMTLVDFHQSRIQQTYGFCTDAFRNGCFYYEPIDMLRKLALSGLLQFVERGTAAQVFTGCTVAFCSFGLQLLLQPYRENEANALKALVDMQSFLTFLVSLVFERAHRNLLVRSFLACCDLRRGGPRAGGRAVREDCRNYVLEELLVVLEKADHVVLSVPREHSCRPVHLVCQLGHVGHDRPDLCGGVSASLGEHFLPPCPGAGEIPA